MGEPAALSVRDRSEAKACAMSIVDEVRNDGRAPSSTLIGQAQKLGLQVDTLILLLAQLALEAL